MPRLRHDDWSDLLNASFFAYASGGGHPADTVTACVLQRVDLGMDLPQHPARAGRVDLLGTCIFPGGLSSSCRWSSFAVLVAACVERAHVASGARLTTTNERLRAASMTSTQNVTMGARSCFLAGQRCFTLEVNRTHGVEWKLESPKNINTERFDHLKFLSGCTSTLHILCSTVVATSTVYF